MSKYNKYKSWLLSVIFTASPGIIKAITFTLLFWILNNNDYANFTVIYSNSIVIGLVGGVGVGTIIIKNRIGLNKMPIYLIMSFFISTPVFLYFIILGEKIYLDFFLISLGVLFNQVSRFYIISRSAFVYGGRFEILNLVLTAILLLFFPHYFPSTIFFVYSLNVIFIFKMKDGHKVNTCCSIKDDMISATTIGYTSLISSGIIFMLPSITSSWGDDDLVSSLGLILGVIGIISVIPRSILNNKLKIINESLKYKKEIDFNKEVLFVKKATNKIILPSVLLLIIYILIQTKSFNMYVIYFLVSISFFVYVGQYSLVESNAINFIGKEKLSLLSNIFIFFIFFVISQIVQCYMDNGFIGMTFLCLSCAFLYYVRMLFFKKLINRYMML